jgi:hypothetical protein
MGYYVGINIWYRGTNYNCLHRDGFEYFYKNVISVLISEFCIYKDYIVNMKKFLNIDRSKSINAPFWPNWENKLLDYGGCDDCIHINILSKDIIMSGVSLNPITRPIIKKVTPEFHNFINRRFLLPQICKKFNIPKDIHNYLLNLFFHTHRPSGPHVDLVKIAPTSS